MNFPVILMFVVGAVENFVLYKVPEFFSRKESSATSCVKLGNKIIIFKRPQTSITMTYSIFSDLIILSNIKIKKKKNVFIYYIKFFENHNNVFVIILSAK